MPFVTIDDADDPRLNDFRALTDAQLRHSTEAAQGLYIAESAKVIERACAAGHAPRAVMTQRRWADGIREIIGERDVPIYLVPDAVAEAVTGFAVHRGALASMERPALPTVTELVADARTVVMLDDVTAHTSGYGPQIHVPEVPQRTRSRIAILEGLADHVNVGSVFRNAAALGFDAVLVSPDCADPLYRRAVRVSMGTVFQIPWTRFDKWPEGIELLQEAGYVVAGMTLGDGAITLDQLVVEDHEKLAIVLGSEGHGITPAADHRLDRRVTIPMMNGADSLNVAAASAVAFYSTR